MAGVNGHEPVRAVFAYLLEVRIKIMKWQIVVDVLVPDIVHFAKILLFGLAFDSQQLVSKYV
jgi:hypothetical protein